MQLDLSELARLAGPPPRGEFEDNGCGPRTPLGVLAWLVPDDLYGHDIGPACRMHDWHYTLVAILRQVRKGSGLAADQIHEYCGWLAASDIGYRDATQALTSVLVMNRRQADSFLRRNIRQLLLEDGARAFTAWRISWIFWIGVRLGGAPAALRA